MASAAPSTADAAAGVATASSTDATSSSVSGTATGGVGAVDAEAPLFRIRTITTGVSLTADKSRWTATLRTASHFNATVKAHLEGLGYEVQTVRIATNSFEEYMDTSSASALNADCDAFAACCAEADAGVFVNIGPCLTPEAAKCIPGMLQRHASLNCSLRVGCCKGIPDATMLKAAAETVLQITDVCPTGETCFKFAATFNCAPGIPFFPAGYHEGPRSFAVGLENQNIVVQAFKSANKDLAAAAVNLKKLYEDSYMPIQEACHKLANEHNIPYSGLDASIAPSAVAKPGHTLMDAFESLGLGRFGDSGTLAVCSIITRTLKSLALDICGYSGLMLPPMEDPGLAHRATERTYSVHDLLMFSSVCGLGLDTVPIPGDTPPKKIEALMADVCCLAFRLNKPLACRLFPVKGKAAHDLTTFKHPHLCNCSVFPVP